MTSATKTTQTARNRNNKTTRRAGLALLACVALMLAVAILAPSTADAALIGVDYAVETQDVYPDTTAETVDDKNVDSASLTTNDIGDPTGGTATVDVTVTEIGDDDNLELRGGRGGSDRKNLEPADHAFADLAEDLIIARGGELKVEISGLPSGLYSFTGVFNDSYTINEGFSEGATLDIFLNDANSTDVLVADDLVASNINDDTGTITTSTFDLSADGMNPITISIKNVNDETKFVPLSGFTVTAIPEPTTGILLLLGGTVALLRRRPRRWYVTSDR